MCDKRRQVCAVELEGVEAICPCSFFESKLPTISGDIPPMRRKCNLSFDGGTAWIGSDDNMRVSVPAEQLNDLR